jgi:hyperosmotically inducible protein
MGITLAYKRACSSNTNPPKEVSPMRPALNFAALGAAVLLVAGCNVFKGNETTGQYVDDTTITARAKAALVNDKNVSATDFNIEVYQGNVTLTGVAKSGAEAARAEADIRQVRGVKSVKNATRVASTGTGTER